MPKSDLIFGSFHSANTGERIFKLKPINIPAPERQVEKFEVKGRSGDLLVDYGAYNNVTLEAEMGLESQAFVDSVKSIFDTLKNLILRQEGYQRLEDTEYGGEYRLARAVSVELVTAGAKNGMARITFDAKPQRYLTSGETAALTLSSDQAQPVVIGLGSDIFNDEAKAELSASLLEKRWIVIKAYDMPGAFRLTARYGLDVYNSHVITGDGLLPGQTMTEIDSSYSHTAAYPSYRELGIVGGVTGDHYVYAVNADECIWWQVSDSDGNVLGVSDHVVGQITPPDAVMEYTPLLHIHRSLVSEITQDDIINVNGTGSISFYQLPPQLYLETGQSIPIEDLYIDCETYNSYAVYEGETYSINPYVTMTGSFLVPGYKPGYYRLGSEGLTYPITLEVIPRWWRV